MNVYDYILIGIIAAWIAVSVILIIRAKKKGKCIGCSNCEGCTACKKCNKK